MTSRRTFLTALGAATVLNAKGSLATPLGLEMYSVRKEMGKDIANALKLVKGMGFDDIECGVPKGYTAASYRALLDQTGLTASCVGADYKRLTGGVDALAEEAHTLGAKWVMVAWIPHDKEFTRQNALDAASVFNEAGAKLRKAGLRLAYHAHGYEYGPSSEGTVFDTLAKNTDASTVFFEMDVFWVAWPGQDPVALLKKYPERFKLMHIKDIRKGMTGTQDGRAPDESNVVIGKGTIDWPTLLKAAKPHVERYYIEDESPDPLEQIPQSIKYLKSLKA